MTGPISPDIVLASQDANPTTEIIEWLESQEGEDWSRYRHEGKNGHSVGRQALWKLKDDYDCTCVYGGKCAITYGFVWRAEPIDDYGLLHHMGRGQWTMDELDFDIACI